MSDIEFTQYDRITDTILYLSDTMSLNFTVGLSRKGKNGDRIYYQYETKYPSGKYGESLRSIRRQISCSFTIDIKDNFIASMMLRPQDVELLVRIIELKVLPWFMDPNSTIFRVINNKIIIGEYEPATFLQDSGKWLSFEPAIYTGYPNDELECRGIKLSLSSGYSSILSIDKFMGFLHILSTTDMYSVACTMINYVKLQPYGVNIYSTEGLGANPNGNKDMDDAWNTATKASNKFAKNSFLDSK